MIIEIVNEAVQSGARLHKAAGIIGLSARTIMRWRQDGGCDRRKGPKKEPANKLSEKERENLLEVANSVPFRDLSPKQIVPSLADQGVYLASESSFYRVLRDHKMLTHHQRSKPPVSRRPREHVASGPCQVWSWDITYLHSSIRGIFYYLYMIVDVWSRKIIAAEVFTEESMEHSSRLFTKACFIHNVLPEGLVLHSDNGGPMKGATMVATLDKLGVTASFSRPSVSNDNPYSESLFRTMKYRPGYPSKPFETIEQAQAWVDEFILWYNTVHLHSAICFITPDDRHYGRDQQILTNRHQVYENARRRHPSRWSGQTRNWNPVRQVWLNPEKKDDAALTHPVKKAA